MKAVLVLAAPGAAAAALAAAAPAMAQGNPCGCPPAHHARIAYHHAVKRHVMRRVAVRTVYVTRVVRVPVAYPVRAWAPPPRPYPVEYRHHWRHEGYERHDARFVYPRDDWRADVYRY